MPVYTVHAPTANGADPGVTDRFVFVRDGFHFWAMIFGPLWLVWNRLWLATIGWIIAVVALEIVLAKLGVGRMGMFAANVLARNPDGIGSCEPAALDASRGASGVSSTPSSAMTRKPPNGASSIAGPPASAAALSIRSQSSAAGRRRPATFPASRSPSRRRCRRAASLVCFRNREVSDERRHH